MRQERGDALMPDGAGDMQRCGIDADDFVHQRSERGAIGKVFELGDMHAEGLCLIGALRLQAVKLGIGRERIDEQRERD